MAEIALKTIKFPGIDNIYTLPVIDSTLTISGQAADAAKVGEALATFVSKNLMQISSTNYGTTLPATNLTEGRVFFLIQ